MAGNLFTKKCNRQMNLQTAKSLVFDPTQPFDLVVQPIVLY